MQAINRPLCKNDNLRKGISCQIFGIDIAPDKNLGAKIIEINKGPDLGFKDDRDAGVKLKVIKDLFDLIGLKTLDEGEENEYIKVWDQI